MRYAETRLGKAKPSLLRGQRASLRVLPAAVGGQSVFNQVLCVSGLDAEPADASETVRTAEVLVPNTCEYDSSHSSGWLRLHSAVAGAAAQLAHPRAYF